MDLTGYKEVLSAAILVPIVWFFLKQSAKREEQLVSTINAGFEKVVKAFKEHESNEYKQQDNILNAIKEHNAMSIDRLEELHHRVGRTILSPEQASRVLRSEMWYVTKKKLDFIRDVLEKNHVKGREQYIKEKIRVALDTYSQEYVNSFSTYDTPVGSMAEWLSNNFDSLSFSSFIDEICDIVFREDKEPTETVTRMKVGEIETIMQMLQNRLAAKLLADCKKK